MIQASLPPDEEERLAALHRYGILDTPPEAAFDDAVHLASQACGAPIALLSLVDTDRQWFKAKVGVDVDELARDISFCGHAIQGEEVFEVPDALEDERFHDNPLVTGAPNIRFYAGAPLVTHDGYRLGTICVVDRVPRLLTAEQRAALAALSREVVTQLELRSTNRILRQRTELQEVAENKLRKLNAELEQRPVAGGRGAERGPLSRIVRGGGGRHGRDRLPQRAYHPCQQAILRNSGLRARRAYRDEVRVTDAPRRPKGAAGYGRRAYLRRYP